MMVNLIGYGGRLLPATERDREAFLRSTAGGMPVEARVYRVVPGSSLKKQADHPRRARELVAAIRAIDRGMEQAAAIDMYTRAYGPGLKRALNDYYFARAASGGAVCAQFHDQVQDGCDGCTFDVGTGGPEGGYGGNCQLSDIFVDSPDEGFGKGDPVGYDPDHTPGKGEIQRRRPPGVVRRSGAGKEPVKWPGDTIVNNDLGFNEPFGDEQGVKGPPRDTFDRGPTVGVPIDPVDFKVDSDNNQKKEEIPAVFQPERTGGEEEGEFSTHEPPSVGKLDSGTHVL